MDQELRFRTRDDGVMDQGVRDTGFVAGLQIRRSGHKDSGHHKGLELLNLNGVVAREYVSTPFLGPLVPSF